MTSLLASLALVVGLQHAPQLPPLADGVPSAPPASDPAIVQAEVPLPAWVISVRTLQPVTTTDPQHLGVTGGIAHTGAYRANLQYQPSDRSRFGMISAALGVRLLTRDSWQVAVDIEHTQARPVRRLIKGSGWELAGHDRHQLSLGTATVQRNNAPWFGLVRAFEVGAGRMQVWRLVSASAGVDRLSASPDPILESGAPVGLVGMTLVRQLFWGFEGHTRFRLIGAGRSKGGEVPFAHLTAEWDVTRQIFHAGKLGRGFLGLAGSHATSARAATYFQNGVGLAFRLAF
jgi:hypothetical protein